MSLQIYRDALRNFETYFASLKPSSVKFLYFKYDGDVVSPYVTQKCYHTSIKGQPLFVVKGAGHGWCYFYETSAIKYLITQNNKGSVVAFEKAQPYAEYTGGSEVYHGDHLTLGVQHYGRHNAVVLKTHKTVYIEDLGIPYNYNRIENGVCNIRMLPAVNKRSKCVHVTHASITDSDQTLANVYKNEPYCLDIVLTMHSILLGNSYSGQRGGIYTLTRNGKKKYISGGSPISDPNWSRDPLVYKGVSCTDDFIDFIRTFVLQPVADLGMGLHHASILYDYNNEFDARANQELVILYDFEHDRRNIFYINMLKALTAFYAYKNPDTKTIHEAKCFEEFATTLQNHRHGLLVR